MKIKFYTLCIVGLCISGCAHVSNGLNSANKTLLDLNSGLKGGQSIDEVKQIILNTDTDGQGREMLLQASGNVSSFLTTNACITSFNGSPLNRYAIPGKTFSPRSHFSPVKDTKYHNDSKCMHIKNISNVKVLAANAFKFETVYISPESQEAIKKRHTLIRQSNGEWLFKR